MNDPTAAFTNLVPGFDFLQTLVKNASAAMPGVGQWVTPTLDPEALEKRISELRTVQFWLEQNARLLGTTVQALEVQRMTLTTLKTMNVSFGDLTESLKIRVPAAAEAAAPAANPFFSAAAAPNPFFSAPAPAPAAAPAPSAEAAAPVAPAGVIDPMQWWSALTQQFSELAANAMKDSNTDAARNLAGAMVQQGIEAAGATLQQAGAMPLAAAQRAAAAVAQQMAGATGAAGAAAAEVPAAAKAASRSAARPATSAARKPAAAAKTGAARKPR